MYPTTFMLLIRSTTNIRLELNYFIFSMLYLDNGHSYNSVICITGMFLNYLQPHHNSLKKPLRMPVFSRTLLPKKKKIWCDNMLTVLSQEKNHSLALVHYGNRQNFKFKQVEFSSKKEISNPKRKDDHNQDCCSFSFCHLCTNSDVAQTLQCQLCNGMLCSNSNPKHIWVYLEHFFKLFPLQTPENRNLVLQSHFVNINQNASSLAFNKYQETVLQLLEYNDHHSYFKP